jgi:hypothetical protein
MANDDRDKAQRGILGDINPTPDAVDRIDRDRRRDEKTANADDDTVATESMSGGSQQDRTQHSGSRDVTEGTTGGTGTEVGGSRNYRQGSGATGMDIGNRPE